MDSALPSLSHIIELAVAPVFLLAGIAGFLNVMSGRLGRITDRVRGAERELLSISYQPIIQSRREEILLLWRRIKVINWAIALCTASALMVCSVIVSLFTGELWHVNLHVLVVTLFVFAMLFLITALLLFILEIKLATLTIRLSRTVR